MLALGLTASCGQQAIAQDAVPCVLLGKADTPVVVDGQSVTVPARLPNCSELLTKSEGVTMCFGGSNGRRSCMDIKPNVVIRPPTVLAGTRTGIAPTVVLLLRGDVQTRPGMTRAGASIEGFPTGSIFLGDDDLVFSLRADKRVAGATKLEIRQTGTTNPSVIEFVRAPEKFIVLRSALQDGALYQWTVYSPRGTFTGRFVTDAAELRGFKEALNAINSDQSINESGRAYLKAELFQDFGLTYNRDREIERLRAMLAQ